MRRTITFKPLGAGRVTVVLLLCALFVVSPLSVAIGIIREPLTLGSAVFAGLVVLTCCWFSYGGLYRLSIEARFDGERLRWKSAFRTGQIDVREIEEIRGGFVKVDIRSRTHRITLLPTNGHRTFLEEILRVRPDLQLPTNPTLIFRRLTLETLTYED